MIFNFRLTEEQAQVVVETLAKEQYLVVAEVIAAIQEQALEQLEQQKTKDNDPTNAGSNHGEDNGV